MSADLIPHLWSTPDTWWEISTDRSVTIRVTEEEKERVMGIYRAWARGDERVLNDALLVEGVDISGAGYGLDVRHIDSWWLMTPEARDHMREHNARLEDEADDFDRQHQRGRYKPKEWSPEDDG